MPTRHLCIVSSEPFRSAEFLATLQVLLAADDELEIILDRDAEDHPAFDRRRHPHVDVALRTQGFFLVPDPPADAPRSRERPLREVPDERERLDRIMDFESRQEGRTRLRWLLLGLLGVILALLVFWPTATSWVSRLSPTRPPAANRMSEAPVATPAPAPPVATTPAPPVGKAPPPVQEPAVSPPSAAPPTVVPERPAPALPKERQDTAQSRDAETRPRPEATRPKETPDAARSRDVEPRPRPEATRPREALKPAPPPPPASAPPVVAPRRAPPPPGFPGLPRVEVIRQPAPGRGDNGYGVRVFDAAGRPLADAEVSVLLVMPDGAVLDVPLSSGPEPGTYQGSAPPGRPAPASMRVRVVTSDRRVEIPVGR